MMLINDFIFNPKQFIFLNIIFNRIFFNLNILFIEKKRNILSLIRIYKRIDSKGLSVKSYLFGYRFSN
jgi:hypothetical protein